MKMLIERKLTWLENKQEKWERIYAIRVFHSNPTWCIFFLLLHLLRSYEKKTNSTNSTQYLSILCLHYPDVACSQDGREKFFSQGNNISRSILMLIAFRSWFAVKSFTLAWEKTMFRDDVDNWEPERKTPCPNFLAFNLFK